MKPAPPPIDLDELHHRAAEVRTVRRPLWLRWAALAVGAGLLVWLPIEDIHVFWPLLFSGLACFLIAAFSLWRVRPDNRKGFLLHLLAGLLAGALLPLGAVFLMVFKSGAHGHGVPDFSPGQISSVLFRIPIFALGGLLMGLGAALWRKAG
jgi:hypothetical protein